jgi:hypothetical protein
VVAQGTLKVTCSRDELTRALGIVSRGVSTRTTVQPARLGGSDEMDNLVTVCVLRHRQADAQLRRTDAAILALERFEDDPERGIFWSPPSEPGGKPQRWSRPWYDWRAEELEQRNC